MEPERPTTIETGAQRELFPADEMAVMLREDAEHHHCYTADLLLERHPDKYRLCVHLLANGYGRLRIADLLHVSHHTVQAVLHREGEAVAMEKERIARLARYGAGLLVEGILEDVADETRRRCISARDKAITLGVLVDKALILDGEPNVIVGEAPREFSHEDLTAYLDRIPRVVAVETGRSGESGAQKGPGRGPTAPGQTEATAAGAATAGVDENPGSLQAPAGAPQAAGDGAGCGHLSGDRPVLGHPGGLEAELAGLLEVRSAGTASPGQLRRLAAVLIGLADRADGGKEA